MTDWSKLYDEFLYDCYIANQRLTEDDWHYYGREEHHIQIPARDGGLLTPLNSQYLTKYQHWVAGVLQSEVLGKYCFAYIPKGELPAQTEAIRIKWAVTHAANHLSGTTTPMTSERAQKGADAQTPEQRRQRGIRAADTRKRNGNNTLPKTPEGYAAMKAKKRDGARKMHARRTAEERSAIARKGHETRRLRKLGLL